MKAIHSHHLRSAVSAGAVALVGVTIGAGMAFAAPVENEVILQAIDEAGANGDIKVQVSEDGIVRLTGLVDETRDGQLAVNAAQSVPGIIDVVDRMRTDDD